jgi:hypothetical protein
MHLIQTLLPLYDNAGKQFPKDLYIQVRRELVERFGGLTVYTRAPLQGLWREDDRSDTVQDDLVIYEVMTEDLDTTWWRRYRSMLEKRFEQEALLIRSHPIAVL